MHMNFSETSGLEGGNKESHCRRETCLSHFYKREIQVPLMQCFFNAASKRVVILLLLYVKQLKRLNIDEM